MANETHEVDGHEPALPANGYDVAEIDAVAGELEALYGDLRRALPDVDRRVRVYEQIVPRQHRLGELLATDRRDAEHDKDPGLL